MGILPDSAVSSKADANFHCLLPAARQPAESGFDPIWSFALAAPRETIYADTELEIRRRLTR